MNNSLYNQPMQENKSIIRKPFNYLDFTDAQKLVSRLGDQVTLLNGNFKELLKEFNTLGEVVAVTGNNHCKIEHKGIYRNIKFEGETSYLYGYEMDIQFFLPQWKFGFAVDDNDQLSFQFFDKKGRSVHKLFLTNLSTRSAWFRLMALYKSKEKKIHPADIQDFFNPYKKSIFINAIPPLPEIEGFVRQVNTNILENILVQCTEKKTSIKLIVANKGCWQLYNGELQKFHPSNSYYNLLGNGMRTQIHRMAIADTYIVKMPYKNRFINYLEIFGEDGNRVMRLRENELAERSEKNSWSTIINEF